MVRFSMSCRIYIALPYLSLLPIGCHNLPPTAPPVWAHVVSQVVDIYRAPPYPLTLVPDPCLLRPGIWSVTMHDDYTVIPSGSLAVM